MIEIFNYKYINIDTPVDIEIYKNKEGTIDGKYVVISLNRPNHLNALTIETFKEITSILGEIELIPEIKCIVLRGIKSYTKKPSFSSGIDLNRFSELNINPTQPYHKSFSTYLLHKYFKSIENFSKPLIAAIDGYALGGGFELALCCDIIISSIRSIFGFSEISRGIFPAGGGTQKMIKNVGLARTMKLLYSGELFSATQMHKWGYINYLVDDDKFEDLVSEKAKFLGNSSASVLIMIKKLTKLNLNLASDFSFQLKPSRFKHENISNLILENLNTLYTKRKIKRIV